MVLLEVLLPYVRLLVGRSVVRHDFLHGREITRSFSHLSTCLFRDHVEKPWSWVLMARILFLIAATASLLTQVYQSSKFRRLYSLSLYPSSLTRVSTSLTLSHYSPVTPVQLPTRIKETLRNGHPTSRLLPSPNLPNSPKIIVNTSEK